MRKRRFEYKELLSPRGHPTGCFAWCEIVPLCDHEHGEWEATCEDARIEMSRG